MRTINKKQGEKQYYSQAYIHNKEAHLGNDNNNNNSFVLE